MDKIIDAQSAHESGYYRCDACSLVYETEDEYRFHLAISLMTPEGINWDIDAQKKKILSASKKTP